MCVQRVHSLELMICWGSLELMTRWGVGELPSGHAMVLHLKPHGGPQAPPTQHIPIVCGGLVPESQKLLVQVEEVQL